MLGLETQIHIWIKSLIRPRIKSGFKPGFRHGFRPEYDHFYRVTFGYRFSLNIVRPTVLFSRSSYNLVPSYSPVCSFMSLVLVPSSLWSLHWTPMSALQPKEQLKPFLLPFCDCFCPRSPVRGPWSSLPVPRRTPGKLPHSLLKT